MVTKEEGYICEECLSIYKIEGEAIRCEKRCLDNKSSRKMYLIIERLHNSFDGQGGNVGARMVDKMLSDAIEEADKIKKGLLS
jgi:hypothetical protein